MDIVSMALTTAQQNSELLGLSNVAQQGNDVPTAEGGIGGVSVHSPLVSDSGLSLGSGTCASNIIDASVVSSNISRNCSPVILMMEQDEIRPAAAEIPVAVTGIAAVTTTADDRIGKVPAVVHDSEVLLQNGKINSIASMNVVQSAPTTATVLNKAPTTSNGLMNSIPVELSSSTSATNSILGSIASMIGQHAGGIPPVQNIASVNSNLKLTNPSVSRTFTQIHKNDVGVSTNIARQIKTSALQQLTKDSALPINIPLQPKSAATITIKTPPGTSLTGPSGSMSGPLLQTILNNAEVQALMKRNPGQQITIVQIPDESLASANWAINSSLISAVNEAKKIIPSNNTKIINTTVGRKRKKIDEPEEKSKTLKVTRPVKKITRSGRISRPPLYRIRDYKTILRTEEVESGGSSEDDYEDYADQQTDKDMSVFSDKPKNFKCSNCDKSYIGQASLDRHFRQNPSHGTPVGPSPGKKTIEVLKSRLTEDHEDHVRTDFIDLTTEESTSSPLHTPSIRGRGRGWRKRRGRGRALGYSNYASRLYNPSSATLWSGTEKLPLDKRKEKAKELMNTFVDEDFLDVILPRLTHVLVPWEFLLMKTEAVANKKPNFVDIYKEYSTIVKEAKKIAQGCLTLVPEGEEKEAELSQDDVSNPVVKLDITDEGEAGSLGLTVGCYKVNDSLMPVSRLPPPPLPTTPPENETVVEEEPQAGNSEIQLVKESKMDDNKSAQTDNKPISKKSMPSLTPLRNRPLNLKSVVTPGPIAEHPIPPGRPLPQLKPLSSTLNKKASMDPSSLKTSASQIDLTASTAIFTESISSSPDLSRLAEQIPQQNSENVSSTDLELAEGIPQNISSSDITQLAEPTRQDSDMIESLEPGGDGLTEETGNTESSEIPIQNQVSLLHNIDGDVAGLQQLVVPEVIQDVLPEVEDTSTIDIMPVGSTLMQLQDGTFLVQRPDGTTMQIQAPEGMTIETIQELLSVDGAMQFCDGNATEIPLTESEDGVLVPGYDVNPDLGNEVAAT